MAGQLTVIAHLRALNGQIEETRDFLLGLVAPTRKEPGCVNYDLHQDDEHPEEFTFYENWAERSDWDAHMQTPHLARFQEARDELFALEKIRLMTMVSARAE